MKLKVVLGDWSHDGHGMTETYYVELPTVFSTEELNKMYELGVKQIGFDLVDKVCRRYGDNQISKGKYQRLVELGYKAIGDLTFQLEDEEEDGEDYEDYYVDEESFMDMYFFFVQLGYKELIGSDDSFSYHVISDNMPSVNIGGYGLFFN